MKVNGPYRKSAYMVLMLSVILMTLTLCTTGTVRAQGSTIGAWIEYESQDSITGSVRSSSGINCIIVAAPDDSLIVAFDIPSGEWHEFEGSVDYSLDFSAAAGDNAAMVWSDSVLVGYSGLMHTFATIEYDGSHLLSSSLVYGCHDDMGYYVSDNYWYVFDAETAMWYSYPVPAETWEFANVEGKAGYVLLNLRNTDDHEWYIMYSHITKMFFELSAGYAGRHELLDFGCVFWNQSLPSGSRYLGAYSAVNGVYESHLSDNFLILSTADAAEDYYPRTCFMFVAREVIDYNNYLGTLYGFDTRNGHFTIQTFAWQPGCDTVCVYDSWNGATFAIQVVKEGLSGDSLGFYVYSGTDDVFRYFTSPMVDPGSGVTPRRHACGGEVFTSTDFDIFMGYDVVSDQFAYADVPPYVTLIYEGVNYWVSNTWGGGSVQRNEADTVHLYSYNQTGNSVQELVEYSDYDTYDKDYMGANVFAYVIRNADENNTVWFYSPGTDNWSSRAVGDWFSAVGITSDLIFFNDGDALELVVFDGLSGQQIALPNGRIGSTWVDYTTGNDNYIVSFDTDSNYNAYSTITHSGCQIKDVYLWWPWTGADFVVFGQVGIGAQGYHHLTYNALYNCFIPLTLTAEQGFRSSVYVADDASTALILTYNRHLLAFDPHAGIETSVDDDLPSDGTLPQEFRLSQNYPNPFNPNTVISFDLPRRSKVALDVLNLLGQRVTTLVDEELPAGVHRVDWDGCNESGDRVASGLYFYRLTADGRAKSRKMMLLK